MTTSNSHDEVNAPQDTAAPTPQGKRNHKRLPIALGITFAVVVVAGAGFMVWHEQPSFCNAICHTPMDPYLPTYEAEPGQAALDKWGATVNDASAMLAATHRVEADTTCMGCHVPTLGEQVTEGLSWVSGDYTVTDNDTYDLVLPERSLEDLVAARGVASDEFCLNEACHNLTREELAQTTSSYARNPHVSQHERAECSDCHKAHRASVYACASCHNDVELPAGWVASSTA